MLRSRAVTAGRRAFATAAAPAAEYDAIIVGAGVIGCSISMQLARAGWRTLNIEKGPSAGSGSTGYSSGCLRSYYRFPLLPVPHPLPPPTHSHTPPRACWLHTGTTRLCIGPLLAAWPSAFLLLRLPPLPPSLAAAAR